MRFFIVCVGVWNGTPEPGSTSECCRSTFQNFQLRFFNQWLRGGGCVGLHVLKYVDIVEDKSIIAVLVEETPAKGRRI